MLLPEPDERGSEIEKDENREPQEDDTEATKDLEVEDEKAENVSGGLRSNPDAAGHFA